MRYFRSTCHLTLCLIASLGCGPCAFAADPAELIPETAHLAIRWKAPKQSIERVAAYSNRIEPESGETLKTLFPMVRSFLSLDLDRIDDHGDWWLFLTKNSRVVFMIPVKDTEQTKQDLLRWDLEFEGKYAIYSYDRQELTEVRERLRSRGKSIWEATSPASKALFERSGFSVLVNVPQLLASHRQQFELLELNFNNLLESLTSSLPPEQRPRLTAALTLYRSLGLALIQGVKDSRFLVVGATTFDDRLSLEHHLQVTPDTETARLLARQPASPLAIVSQLPPQKSAYFAAKLDLTGMVDLSTTLMKSTVGNITDEQQKAFDDAARQMRALKFGEMAGYLDLDPAFPGALRIGSVTEVTPADQLRQISLSLAKSMESIEAPGLKQTMTLEPAGTRVGGVDVDRITIHQEFDPQVTPLAVEKINEALFGKQGLQQLIHYEPGRMLQAIGGPREMLGLMESVRTQRSQDASPVLQARSQLPARANIVALIDLPRLLSSGIKLAQQQNALKIDATELEKLAQPPSFVRFSLTFEPTAISSKLEVPIDQSIGVAKLTKLLRKAH